MNARKYKSHIQTMYDNQSLGVLEYKGLYSKLNYEAIYKDVLELIVNYGYLPIEILRDFLYYNSGIEEKLKFFIKEKGITPGAVISYGTPNYNEIITIGNAKEVGLSSNGSIIDNSKKMDIDTIFDLASVSKIFMTLSVLKLVEYGFVNINDDITRYCPEFSYLKGVTIFDLITFKTPLVTDKRLDDASDKGEAENILHNIRVNDMPVKSVYSDMGVMVLKYVVEKASGMHYYDFIDHFILKEANMLETSYKPVDISRVASTNFRTQIMKDNTVKIDVYPDGQVNDPKAQIMESTKGDLCGHAGMFSTACDMTNLALSIINGSLLSKEEIDDMTKNQTGSVYYENNVKKAHQYFGYLCYLKNPILKETEVYHSLSSKAFAYAGFTGTQFTVDPINGLYLFLGSNRVHDRITNIDPNVKPFKYHGSTMRDLILVPDNGFRIDSRSFAYERDNYIIRPLLILSMQYKMLDDLYMENNLDKPLQRVRSIDN